MHLTFRNVSEAFAELVRRIHSGDIRVVRKSSRNGMVLKIKGPVLVTYTSPTERVLFNASRDINPASLVFESLWTLAGRNDVKSIAYFTKQMAEYSDDGRTWHGAYGYRWRTWFGKDQLDKAVELLRNDKDSRRVVLTMWDPKSDLLEQKSTGKDYPCNTHAYLSIQEDKLDLTVCNRSNDMCWGMLGANYVVFSFLLEYLSSRIGVAPGNYHQFTNDLHVYDWNWRPTEWLREYESSPVTPIVSVTELETWQDYPSSIIPLVKDPAQFEKELPVFVEQHAHPDPDRVKTMYQEPFLADVADPLLKAFHSRKGPGWDNWRVWVKHIKASDWAMAMENWCGRREKKSNVK